MSGTSTSTSPTIHPLPSANHKHYTARRSSTTPHQPSFTTTPTSLAHDLLQPKHSTAAAAQWLKKQRREFELNRDIRHAKQEARVAEEVEVGCDVKVTERSRMDSTLSSSATDETKGR